MSFQEVQLESDFATLEPTPSDKFKFYGLVGEGCRGDDWESVVAAMRSYPIKTFLQKTLPSSCYCALKICGQLFAFHFSIVILFTTRI